MRVTRPAHSVMRRTRESVKQEGFWPFLIRALVSPGHRAVALRAFRLNERHEEWQTPLPVRARQATQQDVCALADMRPEYRAELLRTRLRRGHRCFLSTLGDSVAACIWACQREAHLAHADLALKLLQNEVYTYDAFVLPGYRGKRVRPPAWNALLDYYQEQGVQMGIDCAVRGRKPWGTDKRYLVATISTLRLGPFRKSRVNACGPQAEYWRERLRGLRWA